MHSRSHWVLVAVLAAGLPKGAHAQVVVPPDYEVTTFATGIRSPEGLAIDAAGNLYVAATGSDEVVRITPEGVAASFASSKVDPLAFMPGHPTKMTFGADGFLYVGAVGAYNNPYNRYGDVYDKLMRISLDGDVSVAASGTGCCANPFDDPSGIALGPDGRIYFTDVWTSRAIFAYSPTDGRLEQWVRYPWAFGVAFPSAAVFDPEGNLVVSFVPWKGTVAVVQRFAPDRSVSTLVNGVAANALRYDSQGTLWLADSDRIYLLAPDGGLSTFASGIRGARDLIFDPAGNVYVTESASGSVLKISLAVISVAIDVKPGSVENPINAGARGKVPVAILSTPTFDARSVDPSTVTLASAPVAANGKGHFLASFEDVNGDGLADLVLHVPTQELRLAKADTTAVLEGRTFQGRRVRGSDTVRLVP